MKCVEHEGRVEDVVNPLLNEESARFYCLRVWIAGFAWNLETAIRLWTWVVFCL